MDVPVEKKIQNGGSISLPCKATNHLGRSRGMRWAWASPHWQEVRVYACPHACMFVLNGVMHVYCKSTVLQIMDGFLHHEWVKLFMINISKLKWLSVLYVDVGQHVLNGYAKDRYYGPTSWWLQRWQLYFMAMKWQQDCCHLSMPFVQQ